VSTRDDLARLLYTSNWGDDVAFEQNSEHWYNQADAVLGKYTLVEAEALSRIEEAVEEIANCPILSAGSGSEENPGQVTMHTKDLWSRMAAAREAIKALPIPDANPVLTPEQRVILREAVDAYDRPLEHERRHTDRQTLDRALKRIMHREGIQ
jgi:isoaspartyl peptidase/L-asparaginase-like protein (Ntn-hydrolase superfamily)